MDYPWPAQEDTAVVTRITNSIISRQVTRNLQLNMQRLSRLQMQLSSTKRFDKPSDNPIDYTQALNLREILTGERRFVRNIQNAVNILNLNDTTLSAVNDVIQRARELALAGSSDSLGDAERRALAEEVGELIDRSLELANTRYGATFIYAGNRTDRIPFVKVESETSSVSVRYQGDSGERHYEVSQQVTVPVFLTGIQAFFGERGTLTATQAVGDPTAALDTQLAGVVPAATSGTFSINGVDIAVDLATDSLEDLRDRINATLGADVIASIDRGKLEILSLRADDARLEDGTSNILQALGMHRRLAGDALGAPGSVTGATTLAALGITPGNLRLTVGEETVDVDLSAAVTVDDVLTTLNGLGLPINAFINADQSGITISATQSTDVLSIEDVSRVFGSAIGGPGITSATRLAADLGIAVPLGSIEIINNSLGFEVDLSSAATVGDVLELINNAGAGVQAVINEAGTGIDVIATPGTAQLQIAEVGAGTTAAALGILGSDLENTAADLGLQGESTLDQVASANIFKALIDLRDALLQGDDPQAVSGMLDELDTAFTLNNDNRATVGARTNRLDLALSRYEDSDLYLSQLISENEDIDLAKTVTDLQMQETVVQATLNSASRLLLPSLLDFLPI